MADIKADNESLVFALRTLGFYMERDRLVLEAMSPKDQNVRLKKAFDRAVENVCIMSLLYDVKESRAGKLKLSNRRKWSGWQENRNALYIQTIRDTPGDQVRRGLTTLAKCLGKHSIWASIRMGHYSVERSVEIQGASVRRAIDVPELETFLSRCILQPALNIDTAGSSYTGSWWAITRIPACDHSDTLNEPWPNQTQAVIAIRPLDVIELELPAPIDTAANEPDEQDMAQAGYVGNENRKAVPVVVVRYATSSSGFGTSADVQALITHSGMDRIPPQVGYITPLQLSVIDDTTVSLTAAVSRHRIERNTRLTSHGVSKSVPPYLSSARYIVLPQILQTRSRLGAGHGSRARSARPSKDPTSNSSSVQAAPESRTALPNTSNKTGSPRIRQIVGCSNAISSTSNPRGRALTPQTTLRLSLPS